MPNIKTAASKEAAASDCAAFILLALQESLKTAGSATLAISGGTTPKLMFSDLAKSGFDWSKVHLFWVDERCVPPDSGQSNFKLADDSWLTPGQFPKANIHRVLGELEPAEGGQRYAAEIRQFFHLNEGQIPEFDVIHRGMGGDCHTASLFPGEPFIQDRTGIASNVWVEKTKMHRVTLLPAVLLAAKTTVLQVAGADKADALKLVLEQPEDWMQYPCQMASRDSRATWFLDQAAAARL